MDNTRKECPCRKTRCRFHGKCDECRKAHAKSMNPRPCEREENKKQ